MLCTIIEVPGEHDSNRFLDDSFNKTGYCDIPAKGSHQKAIDKSSKTIFAIDAMHEKLSVGSR